MKLHLDPASMADLGVAESVAIEVPDDWAMLPAPARRLLARALIVVEQEELMHDVREAHGDVLLACLTWRAGGMH